MNVIAFKPLDPQSIFPWFDEYLQHNTLCKIYNDGSCYIAIAQSNLEEKREYRRVRYAIDDLFDELYFKALKENVSRKDISSYIKHGILEIYPEEKFRVDEFIAKKLKNVYRNLSVRKKRFRRKAFLNPWNYFVTITYSDSKHDEESFRTKLKKCLSNYHTRRGWRYMGVFEHAPETGRLHFHAIMYIPDGEMPGKIFERKDYSTKQHKIQISHPNSFFENQFGRCDFESISDIELRRGTTLNYLLKYLEKTEERIIYSRGIPTEFYMNVNEDDVVCEMLDFVTKYVLFNDVVDYDADVRHVKSKKDIYYTYTSPLPS